MNGALLEQDLAATLDIEAIDAELARRRWHQDAAGWIQEKLGEFLWSKQIEIANAISKHRRVAVQSCHGPGKSFLAARIAAWWLETVATVGEAFVVTSAPTAPQVRAILWREMNRAHGKGNLRGRCNQTEWWMDYTTPTGEKKEELVAFGRKPDEMSPASFQGIHARRVLVIFDEGGGIPAPLYESADSLISNDDSKMFVIGNPDDPTSHFAKICKPGSGWHVIKISAFDTPNLTGEAVPDSVRRLLVGRVWVDEKKKAWGETNPLWTSKILGEFPEVSEDGLIPVSWVRAAQQRSLEKGLPVELGVDVGGGGDASVRGCRWGPVFRIVGKDHQPNTMAQLGFVQQNMKEHGATVAKVDRIGIGKGMVDRAEELEKLGTLPRGKIQGINVGEAAINKEQFANLKAELSWGVRERFQNGEIDLDPNDDDLAAQCCAIKYYSTSSGKIAIESKDDYCARMKTHSPDDWDALVLAYAPPKKMSIGIPVGIEKDYSWIAQP